MTKSNKTKKKLLTGKDNQLLQVKDVLDMILVEAETGSIPGDVRTSIVALRDECWQKYISQTESRMPK